MDRLTAMQVFVAVIEAGSFVRAAELLHLSTTAVSRHMSELETHLGARLVQRTTRRMSLTEAGRRYYERCREILAAVEEAEADALADEARPRGLLRVNLPHGFGLAHVAPHIPTFSARYPELKLELSFSDRVADLVEEGIDVALRISTRLPEQMVARQLCPIHLVACAAPAYLQAHGVPAHPQDLKRHLCLTYAYGSGDGWNFREGERGVQVTVSGRLRANSGEMLRLAALAGQGIAMQPTFIVGADLRQGALVEVLREFRAPPLHAHAIFHESARRSLRVRTFVSFLEGLFGTETPYWDR